LKLERKPSTFNPDQVLLAQSERVFVLRPIAPEQYEGAIASPLTLSGCSNNQQLVVRLQRLNCYQIIPAQSLCLAQILGHENNRL
jgi:hypothetical protein